MKTLQITRENNFLIRPRPLEIFINDKSVDYIEPNQKNKKIDIDDNASKFYIKDNSKSSNIINLNDNNNNFIVTSQIQNGLFLFIVICFIGGIVLFLTGYISAYLGFASLLPMCILAYWQTIGKKNYFRISKIDR